MDEYICLPCPHCGLLVFIFKNEINCQIFRHGAARTDANNQMNPHEQKAVCDDLEARGAIYGCGKPFRVVVRPVVDEEGNTSEDYDLEISDYI